MRPVVDGLVKKYSGQYDIRILNTSRRDPKMMTLAQTYQIQYVPTFVFVSSDGSLAGSVVGAVPASQLERELGKLT
jgi:thioredoxin-like negative regulator of GroEL